MKSVWMVAIGMAAWLSAMDAHAGFLVESKPASSIQQGDCNSPGVRELGDPATARPLIAPLTTEDAASALRRIVPRAWSIGGDAPTDVRVSWRGGRPWLAVLHDLAVDAGLCITLDHAQQSAIVHVIDVASPSPAPAPEAAVAAQAPVVVDTEPMEIDLGVASVAPNSDMDNTLDAEVVGLSGDAAEPVDIAPVDPPKVYGVKGGELLEETLARWCEAEGWTLVWQVDEFEYPQEVTYEFPAGTTFETAVKTVIRAYWRTKHPLVARPALNQVLVITGR